MVEPPKLIPEILSANLKSFEAQQKWIAKVARTLKAAKSLGATQNLRFEAISAPWGGTVRETVRNFQLF
jgi:hypothetical protein